MSRRVVLVVCTFSVCIMVLATYFFVHVRYFSKSVTIEPVDDFRQLAQLEPSNSLNIEPFIGSIPYKGGFSYAVEPKEKFERAIINGEGDCSNLSFGLSYYLNRRGIDYSLVHFFKVGEGFLEEGHVALQTNYHYRGAQYTGVVDLLEGGVPTNQDHFVNVGDLVEPGRKNYSIRSFSTYHDDRSLYYQEDFLSNSVIGIMTSKEVGSYLSFIENVYLDLGNDKLEKYFFDLTAILLGKYPMIYVTKTSYEKIFAGHEGVVYMAKLLLWLVRCLPIVMLILIITMGVKYLRNVSRVSMGYSY